MNWSKAKPRFSPEQERNKGGDDEYYQEDGNNLELAPTDTYTSNQTGRAKGNGGEYLKRKRACIA